MTRLRVGRFLYGPSTRVGELKYCPVCGGKAGAATDTEETYWESLSEAYELPVEAVRAVYSIWDANAYPKFSDFVQEMKNEARKLESVN
jgi:hypothetical protein